MATLGKQRVRIDRQEPEQTKSFKLKIADLIDELEYQRGDKNTNPASGEKQRLLSIAQSKLEEACMFATKAFYTE